MQAQGEQANKMLKDRLFLLWGNRDNHHPLKFYGTKSQCTLSASSKPRSMRRVVSGRASCTSLPNQTSRSWRRDYVAFSKAWGGAGLEASIYGLTVKLFKGFFLESLRLLTVVKQISGRGDMENVVTGALNPTNDRHGNSCCTEINKV